MIAVTQKGKRVYVVKFTEPEHSWIVEAAKGMGMDRCSVLGAAFTKGIQYYFDMIRKLEQDAIKTKLAEDEVINGPNHAKDHKEFHKGSCQG